MKVLQQIGFIYRCPICHSILDVEPSDIVMLEGVAKTQCPCCKGWTWIYEIKDFDKTIIKYNKNIKLEAYKR